MAEHSEMHKKMKGRNYALAIALVAFVVLFGVVTFVKLKTGVSG